MMKDLNHRAPLEDTKRSTHQNKAFSSQNKGHLDSR